MSPFEWQLPERMASSVDALREDLGHQAMLRPGREYREAFIAARFALHRNAELVRLIVPKAEPTPDFAIQLAGQELWFETTEVDRPGRRRGEEYKDGVPQTTQLVPGNEWVTPEEYLAVIGTAVLAKARKAYEKCDGLIIWSNAFPISDWDSLTDDWWAVAARPAISAFDEVWRHHRGEFRQIK